MRNTTTTITVAALAASAAVLLTAGPAAAQVTGENFVPSCASGVLAYPLGSPDAPELTDAAPEAGDTITVTSGEGAFDPGSTVGATLFDPSTDDTIDNLGDIVADFNGRATLDVEVPSELEPGTYIVILTGVLGDEIRVVSVCVGVVEGLAGVTPPAPGQSPPPAPAPAPAPVVVPVVVPVAAPIQGQPPAAPAQRPAAAPQARPAALPFTGSVELIAVAGLGAGLLALGAGTVVVARRRRETELPA